MLDSQKTVALDSWHRARGARMVAFAGYQMPVQYEGIIAEHQWTRQSAGLFDVSHMGQLLLSGPGADEALETLVPSDIAGLAQGRLRYSVLLNAEGGIIDDLMITRRSGDLYLVVNAATAEADIAHLRRMLPNIALTFMEGQALLALQGPSAAAVLARFAPGVDQLGFMTAAPFRIEGTEAWIGRSGYTGEDGFEISIADPSAGRVVDLLASQPEVRPAGLGARDSLRLEAGLPLYGHDIDEHTSPVEADLGFVIARRRRSEGGFPGAPRIIRELEEGSQTRRVGLAIDGRQPVREGATVVDADGREIGRVTSGGHAPSLSAPIAMAYVPAALAAPGTSLTLEQRGKPFAAQVVDMPFVPHRYHRKGAVHEPVLHQGT